MGPQRSVAAVVAAGFAVIASIIVVAWVASHRADGSPAKPTVTTGVAADAPEPVLDETHVVPVLITSGPVPAGTDLGAAIDQGSVTTVEGLYELVPEDFLSTAADHHGTKLLVSLEPGVVLTKANTKAGVAPETIPPPAFAVCPRGWTGTVASDERVVFVVTANVSQGTSVAQAYNSGYLRPVAAPARYVPPTAPTSLTDVCDRVAAFGLTKGTVLTPATFVVG